MTRFALVFTLLFAAASAHGEQPSHEELASKLFLMRYRTDAGSPLLAQEQGIWSFDPATRQFVPFAYFFYRIPSAPSGRVQLGATEDRLILQGTDYYEFDLASGRLLRRYRGLDRQFNTWAFHGAVVSQSQSLKLGIPPGFYGFPICPASSGTSGIGCNGPVSFPGYDEPTFNTTRFDLLLRRGLDPNDAALTVVKSLDRTDQPFWASVAVDAATRRLWLRSAMSSNGAVTQRLSTVPISGSDLGEPQLAAESRWDLSTPRDQRTIVREFTFHPASRSFFDVIADTGETIRRLVRRPEDLSREEVVASVVIAADPASAVPDSLVAIDDVLPDRFVQVIPAIGHTTGANGTRWRSDVWLFNPSDAATIVKIRRVARPLRSAEYDLPAHASLELRDVLQLLGGGTDAGGDGVATDALVIDAPYRWGTQLTAYSRTWTPSTRADENGGSYGQGVPAVPNAIGYSNHQPEFTDAYDTQASNASLILDKRDSAQFRHNLGVVNDGDQPLEVRLRYAAISPRPDPDPQVEQRFVVGAHSVANVNLESLFPARFAAERPPRIWITADRPAPLWISMVDNISGDATFVPFSLLSLRSDDKTQVAIPAVANTPGVAGTFWRTDLFGFFLTEERGEENQQPLAQLERGSECASSSMRLQGVAGWSSPDAVQDPYWINIFPDIAHQFGPCGNETSIIGALRLRGASWMAGYSRTYTSRPDGGTFGEILPFYPVGGWPVQHFSGIQLSESFRVNVGLYNGSDETVHNRLVLYDATGMEVARRTIDLAPRKSLQMSIGAMFDLGGAHGLHALSVIPEGSGRSWAYVSIVDNITGDPTNLW